MARQGERRSDVAIGEILRNNVKEKLARDEVVASMTVRLVRTVEIARIAHRRLRHALCRPRTFELLARCLRPDLHSGARSRDRAVRARSRQHAGVHRARARRRRARRYCSAHALGGRGTGRGASGQISSARRAIERQRAAAPAFPPVSCGGGLCRGWSADDRRQTAARHRDRPAPQRDLAREVFTKTR
jgi:hypothetical protein